MVEIFNNLSKKLIWRRRDAYRRVFLDARGMPIGDSEIVLADLRRFCNATRASIRLTAGEQAVDPLAMAVAEGRREVWNRIMSHLYLDDKTVNTLNEME